MTDIRQRQLETIQEACVEAMTNVAEGTDTFVVIVNTDRRQDKSASGRCYIALSSRSDAYTLLDANIAVKAIADICDGIKKQVLKDQGEFALVNLLSDAKALVTNSCEEHVETSFKRKIHKRGD